MICIVSGPTSVGKSTFMSDKRCHELTGTNAGTPVMVPATYAHPGQENILYHYNIMRPLDAAYGGYKAGHLKVEGTFKQHSFMDFRRDSSWRSILGSDAEKRAIVLCANKATLLSRIGSRKHIEPRELVEQEVNDYPQEHWRELTEKVDLAFLYRRWLDELTEANIPYTLVDAADSSYRIIEDEEAALDALRSEEYTPEKIKQILDERDFEYHRVELPHGLHTKGADRRETSDLIFPDSLKGQSVLDVGCALGYFSFEAEGRGAQRVLGVELKDSRYQDALILKNIKRSRVEFRQQNIITDPPDEQFDQVLLLNVIHHLKEPFRAMRQLAALTRKRMVVEFPTLSDEKFKKATGIRISFFYDRLPLVGVSSMEKADQTFVFSPPAIRRALIDHEKMFRRIRMIRSPMKGRVIAICEK